MQISSNYRGSRLTEVEVEVKERFYQNIDKKKNGKYRNMNNIFTFYR